MIADRITDLIGNTPLLRIPAAVHGLANIDLYAKLEMMNPFGSVKDRIAWGMIEPHVEALAAGGVTVLENSSGNTAKALQAICSTYGIPTKLVTYMAKVKEPKEIIRLLGAEIEEVLGGSECFDPNDPNDPQYLIERAVKEQAGKLFFPSQFTNPKNPEVHYETTGAEILADLGRVDYFIGGLGTSGSTMGAARRLREGNPELACIGVCASKHDFIPGIRSMDQMWESGLFEKHNYAGFVSINSGEAVDATMELVRRCGVLCGPTSGASYGGALRYLREVDATLTERRTAVFIVCDRLEWYLSYIRERRPALFREKLRPGSLAHFTERWDGSGPQIGLREAAAWVARHNPLIIDTRSNLAFRTMTVPGAINIPAELLDGIVDNARPFPADRPVLLVCAVGDKTRRYAAYLRLKGCDAWSLEAGMMGWRNAGAPLELEEAF